MDKILQIFKYSENAPMLFNSGLFLVIFTIFFTIYAFIYQNKAVRTVYVILFSLFFYYKSSGWYLFILLFSVILDYWVAKYIYQQADERKRKWCLIVSVVANISLLAYFKYTNFFLGTFASFSHINFQPLDIFLPIGISFYTFQTISYVVDVYKKKIAPAESFTDYAFYMTYFPHLVAGPIVRASHFLPQINRKIELKSQDIGEGLFMILKGLIKKAIIADYVAQYADLVFGTPSGYSGFENLMAMYAYTLQIYCDFSGYTDMAIGFAKIMGFDLGENFRSPYQSRNITDFWRRWHISLSNWLRDYVYIPLGGNRKGEIRQDLNLLATMLVGGLWHGASWKFVFWGGMHGVGLVVHKIFDKYFGTSRVLQSKTVLFLSGVFTFHFVAFLWIFFRAQNFETALLMIGSIFSKMDLAYVFPFMRVHWLFLLILFIGYFTHLFPLTWKQKSVEVFTEMHLSAKILLFLSIFQLVLQMQSENVQPFIYFQF